MLLELRTVVVTLYVEGLFYGLYSGLFAIYLHYHASRKDTNKTQNVIFYSIWALYVLSTAVFACDVAGFITITSDLVPTIEIVHTTSFACYDFIAQFILIYRCWIVWGRNTRVIIFPSILAFTFFVIWIIPLDIMEGNGTISEWVDESLAILALALSMAVNALVTGLIILRIFKVFREVRATSDEQILVGATGGKKLRDVIFILIESGMALFSIQLARLVLLLVSKNVSTYTMIQEAYYIMVVIHQMLTGITPTIILVRTSAGLSFDEDKSLEELAIESLRFESNHANSVPGTGSINSVDQDRDRTDDSDIGIQQDNDIEVVER